MLLTDVLTKEPQKSMPTTGFLVLEQAHMFPT